LASISFDKCFQKSQPFQNFLAEFTNLAKKYKKTEEQKVEALKKKVSESIAKALSTLDNPPSQNDFAASAVKCQTFYDNQQEYEHNHQSHTSQKTLPPVPLPIQP
jgi:Mn-dependent DtxR family transcriptional regulator